MSINVNTYNTGIIPDQNVERIIKEVFDLKPASIINKLGLKSPIYSRFASYGHFGRENNCSWEQIDMVDEIKEKIKEI